MGEFLKLIPPQDAWRCFHENLHSTVQAEWVETKSALGRVLAMSITAPHPLPPFARAAVDGYAVLAQDTFGVSESQPGYLELTGEVLMGTEAKVELSTGRCALIHTGGMLPAGANAVVMLEYTQVTRQVNVEIYRPVSMGENVIAQGEDVQAGDLVMQPGKQLGPAEIGGLLAFGFTRVQVARQPRVGILSSGDELVPPEAEPGFGQVRNINSYSLGALIQIAGGIPLDYPLVPDRVELLQSAASRALVENDLLVITAGSSASERDLTAQVIDGLGKPGVLVHGVAIKPGKPTILAVCDGKPVIGLPGNPVSALVIAGLFVRPLLEVMQGIVSPRPRPTVRATLATNLASQAGREDWIAVHLLPDKDGYVAQPVFGKSNLIFTLVRADGMVRVPAEATGLEAGQEVLVYIN